MPFDQTEPSRAEIDEWFLANPAVPDHTFELGLVLGGTASAGAYTAGALDFLIEALDCWEAARGKEDVPDHRVLLRVITGTSGGGVNGSIAARALNFDFLPVPQTRSLNSGRAGNPFYDTWINDLTLDRFLEVSDLDSELISFLNGKAIDRGALNIVSFTGAGTKSRPWVAAPLRLIITLTNLAGVPYTLGFPRGRTETYVDHADFVRFGVNYAGVAPPEPRPDEFVLDFGQGLPNALPWETFSEFAKGTAAFPGGFPPRRLERPVGHYRYRVRARQPMSVGEPPYWVLKPDWDALLLSGAASADGRYFFLAVDGGVTDNEPVGLAHEALCGILDANPRDPVRANRAIVLVDPFGGKAGLGLQQPGSFADNLGSLFNSIIDQTRYDSRDLALAADPSVFSRFMLTPTGGSGMLKPALASSGLGAFLGFTCADFMRYDYMLGRRDCQAFLRCDFVLAENNAAVFGKPWPESQRLNYAQQAPAGFLPIIPLIGTAAEEQKLDPWPVRKLDPERYRRAIEQRYRALLRIETSRAAWLRPLIGLGGRLTDGLAADKVIEVINGALASSGLS